MDLEKYRELFFTESREYIETMFNLLQKLSGDSTNKTALNEIFRAAHSIKGMAASMEYKDISNLAHAIENLFEKLRTSGDIATDDQIKEIFPYIEALDSLIRHEQGEAKPSVDIYSLINKIESQEKAATAKKTEKKPAAPAKSPVLTLEASIDTAADAPAARAYMVIRKAKDLGKVISSEPDANQLREGKFYGTISINLETEFSEEAIIDAIQSITGVIKVTAGTRVAEAKKKKEFRDQSIRIKGSLLDELLRETGELIISQIQLKQSLKNRITQEQELLFEGFTQRISNLKNIIFSIRLLPLKFLTDRLPRVILESAQNTGKQAEIVISGEDVEIDRLVLDSLHDPLTHILRNSVAHGIEHPDERSKRGKNQKGMVEVRARRIGEFVEIEIQDDGQGMKAGELKAKAVALGIITEEQANKMPQEEAYYLACAPGLSTSENIDSTSGRGVGLDVVKNSVESLGGNLFISSTPGAKTSITLRIPINLSIIKSLIIRVNSEHLAIPIAKIEKVFELNKNGDNFTKNLYEYNGKMLRIIPGSVIIPQDNVRDNGMVGILLRSPRGEYILKVDELLGRMDIYVTPVPKPLSGIKSLLGVSITGDGKPIFLLDPYYIE